MSARPLSMSGALKRGCIVAALSLALISVFSVVNPAIASASSTSSASSAFTAYPIPFGTVPGAIITGPDGALWFAENAPVRGTVYFSDTDEIARLTTAGSFAQFQIPLAADFSEYGAAIESITTGPDGAIWFVDFATDQIERLTPQGQFANYVIPSSYNNRDDEDVLGLATGSDGAIWFTMPRSNKIGRITTTGSVTEYQLSSTVESAIYPAQITSGADGALWFTEGGSNKIGRITTAGSVTEYSVPTPNAGLYYIAAAPDGALWFTEAASKKIGRITTTGAVSEYPLSAPDNSVGRITLGPDGALWFVTSTYNGSLYGSNLGRITTSGDITEYPIFALQSQPTTVSGLVTGPDGALWLTDRNDNQIIRADQTVLLTPSAPTDMTVASVTQTPTISWSAVSGANSYNVYRNGTLIGSTTSTSYVDTSAPEGDNTYSVTAVSASGSESTPSSSASTLTDRTAPSISGAITGSGSGGGGGGSGSGGGGGSGGWSNGDVTVSFTCSDDGSGVQSCPAPITISAEGADHSVSGTAVDNAGNSSSVTVSGINIDKTPPTITYVVTPAANANGWDNSDVTVTFTCGDALSGVASCSQPVTLSTEGGNQIVTGTAVDNAGNTATITASVNLDKTAPLITASVSQGPNAQGWNNTPVTVSYTCADVLSGIQTCSSPRVESTDGSYTLVGTATDKAGNSSSTQVSVNIDQTPPALGMPSWTNNPMTTTQVATVDVPVSDNLSGVSHGEYFLGANNPSQGNGTPLTYDSHSGLLSASFSGLTPGIYQVNFRAADNAGNWSLLTTDYLVVYSTTQSSANGHSNKMLPVYGSDLLPGLSQAGQTDTASVALSVRYNNGQLDSSSKVMFSYETGSNCNNPSKATNCHSTTLSSTGLNWMIINGDNNSVATIQGSATLTIDGTTTTSPFRVIVLDGRLLDPSVGDNVEIQIFAPGADPNTAQPLYIVNEPVGNGNVIVKS